MIHNGLVSYQDEMGGTRMNALSVGLLIMVVCGLSIFTTKRNSSCREKSKPLKPWGEDREPQEKDFTTDMDWRGKTASQKYNEAHYEWVQRKTRRIVYVWPLEEVLKRDDLALWWREAMRRNKRHIRDEGYLETYCPCCHVCGSRDTTVRYNRVSLCNDCYASLESDSREGSDYKLPPGATGFSVELWTLQMIVALDLECGVIDEGQAERELHIIVELERRRIEQEKQQQEREAEKKRRAEQRSNNLSNAASRLR